MTKLKDLHAKWTKDPAYRVAYDALEEEFAFAGAIAQARAAAGLTQAEVAERMHTTQGNLARLEAGRTTPSMRTLERFAQAIGARFKISFEPVGSRDAACRVAEEVLLDRSLLVVRREAYGEFMKRLDQPAQPNERLRRTMRSKASWK